MVEEEKVVLLNFWPSPFGMRLRIALADKGVEYREENLRNKSPLLLQMNPIHKKIPILIHKGKSISESLIDVQYFDEVWPHTSVLVRLLLILQVYDLGRKILTTKVEEQEAAKQEFIGTLKLLEKQLGEKPFFGSENLGFVDVVLLPLYSLFYSYETCGNFSIEAECLKLIAWTKRCLERESVSESLPDPKKMYDFIQEVLKKLGME